MTQGGLIPSTEETSDHSHRCVGYPLDQNGPHDGDHVADGEGSDSLYAIGELSDDEEIGQVDAGLEPHRNGQR